MDKYVVFFILLISCESLASNNYEEATQKATEAFYIQSGLERMITNKANKLQDDLHPYCKKTLAILVPIVDTVIKQRVEITYAF